ncbi:transposase [candidate division WOR-3 bacterium]|nr:transposase [candidate division WOR-3 bacterium]
MGRPLRIEFPGAFYHVVSHGNGRLWLFRDERDYKSFLKILGSGVKKYRVKAHAFVLMRNHIHLLIETPLGNLSSFMRVVLSSYGSFYNWKYSRQGSVFKSRYSSYLVQKDKYYSALIRYIYLNPVEAGIVGNIGDYQWSSLYYLLKPELLKEIPWFDAYDTLSMIGDTDELLKIVRSKRISVPQIACKLFIGDGKWVKEILNKNEYKLRDKNISGRKEIIKDYKVENNIEKIFNFLGVKREELIRNKRKPYYHAAIYLLKEMLPLTNKEIAIVMSSTEYAVTKMYGRMREYPEKYLEALRMAEKFEKMSDVKT